MKTINEILREAWYEIHHHHGVALTNVDFEILKVIDGRAVLTNTKVTADLGVSVAQKP